MKFTASFAVLAVFVSQAVVNAAPMPAAYDLEARADFVDGALEEVWSRFYDELLEEVEAREFDDEEIFERAPMKKFAKDLAVGLGQKAPGYANQYSQSQQAKARNSVARPHISAPGSGGSGRPSGGSIPRVPSASKLSGPSRPSIGQQAKGGFSIAGQAKGAFRSRSFDDMEEEIFERAPMKKFAQDLATGLAQKAPTYAKQYSQGEQNKNRGPGFASTVKQAQQKAKPAASIPKIPASSKWNTVKKPSVMDEIKKLGKK